LGPLRWIVVGRIVIELLVAPALVAVSTFVARRWGPRAGGVVSAFPAIVGPVLLILALGHGRAFAARAAEGTLLGLVSLAAFALVYGRLARGHGWRVCATAGWLAAGLAALGVGAAAGRTGSPMGLVVASAALALACRALPAIVLAPASSRASRRPGEIPLRMASVALLVAVLSAAAGALGAVAGGMLAALPVLACVLAVFTHRGHGGAQAIALLRGMLAGMASFVLFCQVIALTVVPYGIAPAFAAATGVALAVQAIAVYSPTPVHSLLRRQSSAASAAVAAAPGALGRQSS
jgi:F0F1-type ATP synthase assembly protein I